MLGKTVLFNPGYDHAGISTQAIVEKRIYKAAGLTRHHLGHEKFLEHVWAWKDNYVSPVTRSSPSQKLQVSVQYFRPPPTPWCIVWLGSCCFYDGWGERAVGWDIIKEFTIHLVRRLSKGVLETFCQLHEECIAPIGLLTGVWHSTPHFRTSRFVETPTSNLASCLAYWCSQTAAKVIKRRTFINVPGYDRQEKFEFGVLTSFAYPIENSGMSDYSLRLVWQFLW